MNRGTAWVGFNPKGPLLGIDCSPSWSDSLSTLDDAVRSSADRPARLFDWHEPVHLEPDVQPWFLQAHYALDNNNHLANATVEALQSLVGTVTMEPLRERHVMVQVHASPTSVLALHVLEMDLEVRNRADIRHCVICGKLLQRHGNAVSCEGDCSRERKRQNDRERYRQRTTGL